MIDLSLLNLNLQDPKSIILNTLMKLILFSLFIWVFFARRVHLDSASNIWEDTKNLASRAVNLTSENVGRAWNKTKQSAG